MLRKLAMKIAGQVCRLAPTSSKEWGEASAREVDAIENDWAALRWALGSISLIWSERQVSKPVGSLDEIPRLARCAARQVRRRTTVMVVATCYLFGWARFSLLRFDSRMLRAGVYLYGLAAASMLVQCLLRLWRGVPKDGGLDAMAVALRAELVRQREFHSGAWLALRMALVAPASTVLCLGIYDTEQTFASGAMALAVAGLFAFLLRLGWKLQLRTAAAFQRQIDAIDALEPQ